MSIIEARMRNKNLLQATYELVRGSLPVAVYGTLKRGGANHTHYLSNAISLGTGKIRNAQLYASGIPFLTTGEKTVEVELYLVPIADAITVSAMEERAGYITRATKIDDNEHLEYALVYWYDLQNIPKSAQMIDVYEIMKPTMDTRTEHVSWMRLATADK